MKTILRTCWEFVGKRQLETIVGTNLNYALYVFILASIDALYVNLLERSKTHHYEPKALILYNTKSA